MGFLEVHGIKNGDFIRIEATKMRMMGYLGGEARVTAIGGDIASIIMAIYPLIKRK